MPQMIFYNSTKASILSFARDLRYIASKHNIKINVITPGVIDTPMTGDPKQPFVNIPKIFKASPESLAKIVKRKLVEDQFEISWPFSENLTFYSVSVLPPR